MRQRFEGQVALITGGGTGIGAAIARRITEEGGHAVIMGRRRAPLETVAESLGCASFAGDAAEATHVREALELARSQFGRLTILIANAGGHGMGDALSTDDASWARAIHTNLTTAFVSIRECLPAVTDSRGSIVVVSSIAGLFAGPQAFGYVTTKHALLGLTRSIARDYGPRGLRINALCPGWVRTPMADEEMEVIRKKHGLATLDEAYALVTQHVPLRRAAQPEEVAGVACFLASADAAMMSGSVIVVDGGAGAVDLPTLAFAD
jgi:meso-butanediol dehydrogenase/(S,S)-butanediol dehydrogenase/diacetyl reductase